MAHCSHEQQKALDYLHRTATTRLSLDEGIRTRFEQFAHYLDESENQLIALMKGLAPPKGGSLEFGLTLYWIHNELPDNAFCRFLADRFPPSQIDPAEHRRWKRIWTGPGMVLPDGTLYGNGTFEQLDKGWFLSALLYALSILTEEQSKAPEGTTPCILPVGNGRNELNIALIGDWGSGVWDDCGTDGPAAEIMDQIDRLSPEPDIVIHLGDVYYAGTGDLPKPILHFMEIVGAAIGVCFDSREEVAHLLSGWWRGGEHGNSFTLNSNHEMYSNARGYFQDALTASVFSAQQNTSYFALTFEDWVILGLDSAYYSHSVAVMEGRLEDEAHTQQVEWVRALDLTDKKVIVLTHHTALTYDGRPITSQDTITGDAHPSLASDVRKALGREPDYWYWGHIHNGIVYASTPTLPDTKARCLGHAALPFGNAYVWDGETRTNLDASPNVMWYAHTPKPNPHGYTRWTNRVLNGFATLSLKRGSIVEAYYEQGNPEPVWTSC